MQNLRKNQNPVNIYMMQRFLNETWYIQNPGIFWNRGIFRILSNNYDENIISGVQLYNKKYHQKLDHF